MIDPRLREDDVTITDRLLRQFAAIWLAVFGALAVYRGVVGGRPGLAAILSLVAVGAGVPGIFKPRTIEPTFRAAMAIAMPIGWIVSNVLLGVVFYLVITPVALFFRLIKRDALGRRVPGVRSQWVERRQSTDPRSYWHQS
jgi:hypothetical protein